MLKQNCKEYIIKLKNSKDSQLKTIKYVLDNYGWYSLLDENEDTEIEDVSNAFYKYLVNEFNHILSEDFGIDEQTGIQLLDN